MNMKRLWLVLLAAVMTACLMPSASAQEPADGMALQVSSVTGFAGGLVTVDVSVVNNTGLNAVMFSIEFDDTNLEFVEFHAPADDDSFQGYRQANKPVNGEMTIVFSTWDGRNQDANGKLCSIDFKIKDTAAAGNYPITIMFDDGSCLGIDEGGGQKAFPLIIYELTPGSVTVEAGSKPEITAQPADRTYIPGRQATFSVTATGNPAPTYQWQVYPYASTDGWTDIPGATETAYTTTDATNVEGNRFRCIVSNGVLPDATSSAAMLNFTLTLVSTDSASVTAEESTELRVTPTDGTPPYTYLWSNGATQSSILVSPDVTTTYTCTVTDASGVAKSEQITLTVTRAPVDPPASGNAITGITAGQTFTYADTATFTAVGGGADITEPVKNDKRWLPTAWKTKSSGNFSTGFTQSFSAQFMKPGSHTLTVTFTQQQYNGSAWVNTGETDTKNVSFTVSAPPVLLITAEPEDQYVVAGQRATFSMTAEGDNMTYQWYIDRGDGGGWQALDGSTRAKHVTTETNLACDGYRYRCSVRDEHRQEETSAIATLHVRTAPEQPDTGDSAAPGQWLAMLLLGGAGLCILFRRRRRA